MLYFAGDDYNARGRYGGGYGRGYRGGYGGRRGRGGYGYYC